jgi:hypothetical protein
MTSTSPKSPAQAQPRQGTPIADDLWAQLVDVAVLCGALMLLWPKALALEEQTSCEIRAE